MARGIDLALAGATGLVGETVLQILHERKFPLGELHVLASAAGDRVTYDGRAVPVCALDEFDFGSVAIAIFAIGQEAAAEHAPRAAAAGCVVIDNSAQFRCDADVPLVVPEVNSAALAGYRQRNLVANPNCSTIQLVMVLKPIHDAVGIDRVNVATYQSVSGGGRQLVETLASQTAQLMNGRPLALEAGAPQIAFNVVPHIDVFEPNGYTREENKIVRETRKILDEPEMRINATAVRVPVFFGHSEAVHIETRSRIEVAEVRKLLANSPGLRVIDVARSGGYPTAADAASQDAVLVGRIREDISHPRGVDLWIVADNVRKGAATNSVQIAESLVKDYL
ncbi:MAG TPA: aspartate-semialdehyde dehydrogenase [Gammaproteobacteria bacterium]|nr:aspartate-semialdehyde dehydrogenase [Gammaproteobacteria bacterium]